MAVDVQRGMFNLYVHQLDSSAPPAEICVGLDTCNTRDLNDHIFLLLGVPTYPAKIILVAVAGWQPPIAGSGDSDTAVARKFFAKPCLRHIALASINSLNL